MLMSDFPIHPRQQEFFDSPRRWELWMGQRSGRRAATEERVRLDALDAEQAELAINDLRTVGYCLMRNGRRYEPPKNPPAKITFHEVKRDAR